MAAERAAPDESGDADEGVLLASPTPPGSDPASPSATRGAARVDVRDSPADQDEPPTRPRPARRLVRVLPPDESMCARCRAQPRLAPLVRLGDQLEASLESIDNRRRIEIEARAAVSTSYPVVGSCLLTVVLVRWMGFTRDGGDPWRSFLPRPGTGSDTASQIAEDSAVNAAVMLALVIVVTYAFALMYAKGSYRSMFATLVVAHVLWFAAFFAFVGIHFVSLIGWRIDWVSFAWIVFQLTAGGVVAIFWTEPQDAPNLDQRVKDRHRFLGNVFLVLGVVALSWPFVSFPEWTLWAILISTIVWDIIAVLTPCGPLGYIMRHEEARYARGEAFTLPPSLMYEGEGFRLGTGDLLFYSVVVGRAASAGFVTGVFVFLWVIFGLVVTIFLTIRVGHVLPALPIALALGVAGYFLGIYVVDGYARELAGSFLFP